MIIMKGEEIFAFAPRNLDWYAQLYLLGDESKGLLEQEILRVRELDIVQ